MAHINDHTKASEAATGVRAFMASYGVDCDVLPAGDRVVIHLPIGDAEALVGAAHTRGKVLHFPQPVEDELALAY